MEWTVESLVSWFRSLPAEYVEQCLLEDRRRQDFIGRHLPFTLVDDRTFEPVRYELGDAWLDLMVIYEPGYGWEVHVLDRSSEDFDLGDVYEDLRERLGAEVVARHPPIPGPTSSSPLVRPATPRRKSGERRLQEEWDDHAAMNVKRAATELGCSISMIYKLMSRGHLAYLRIGRRRLPIWESVRGYFQRHIVQANRPSQANTPSQANVGPYQFKHLRFD